MRVRLLLVLSAVAVLTFVSMQLWLPLKPDRPVELYIPAGTSTQAIGQQLKHAGIVRSAILFRLLARISGRASRLQSGYYRFESAANLPQVLDRMARGDAIFYRSTVPEGLRTDEVLALMARETGTPPALWRKALHRLAGDEATEGILLPETYTYRRPAQPAAILGRMISAQEHVIRPLLPAWVDEKKLRIIASIVEKETAGDEERALVAAVIRNRLARHMALQMDSTVIYGLWREDGVFSGNLHKADMRRDTPWNTYTRTGLPSTPICNPGKASLIAAARPADVDYLYFVADGSGGHAFASTLAEHEKNVRQWVKIERGGQ